MMDEILKLDSITQYNSIDKHSKALISNNIELLLNYCMRFYDRQFITWSNVNKDILVKFEKLLCNGEQFLFSIIRSKTIGTRSNLKNSIVLFHP